MLFADDAAIKTHTQQELQALTDRFSQACKDFELTTSLKKTKVLGQDTMELQAITIDDYELDVDEQFTYTGSINRPESTHKCNFCSRDCFPYIGLYSHKRRCDNQTDRTTGMYSHD